MNMPFQRNQQILFPNTFITTWKDKMGNPYMKINPEKATKKLNSSTDKKVYVNPLELLNMTNKDDAFSHFAVIKTPEKWSSLASCVTIAPTSKVEPGIVVCMLQYLDFPHCV